MLVQFDNKHPEFADLQRVWQCAAVSHSHYAIAAWKAEPIVNGKQRIIATDGHRLAIYTRNPTGEWPQGANPLDVWPIEPGYYKAVKVRKADALFEHISELEDGMRWPNIEDVIPAIDKSTVINCPPDGEYTNDTNSEYGFSCLLYDLWTRGCPMFNIELATPLRGVNRRNITCYHTAVNKPIRFDCVVRGGTMIYVLIPIQFKN
jgi:hypothetical protein